MSKIVSDTMPYVVYGNVALTIGSFAYLFQEIKALQQQNETLKQELMNLRETFMTVKKDSISNKRLISTLRQDAESSRALETQVEEIRDLLEERGISVESKDTHESKSKKKPKRKPAKIVSPPPSSDDEEDEDSDDELDFAKARKAS